MCDTMVALAAATASGSLLFAKNSDRERNEGQALSLHPAASHAAGSRLDCSYIAIPQVARTRAVLISRPFWGWGAEMGANDAGVVIGNEAMHSHIPPGTDPALTGMDLLRLGLERGGSAAEALEVITTLLERHGQGGNCGHLHPHHYHNGFIIADRAEAYVLETVGRLWVVEKVERFRALSNVLSIGPGRIHRASPALLADAAARGYGDDPATLDFAESYYSPERETQSFGRLRCGRATELLGRDGRLVAADLRAILRDHGAAAEGDAAWHPAHGIGRSICMHAAGEDRRGQSVGSLVSELRADGQVLHWVTGTSGPCLSVFRPVLLEVGLPAHGPAPRDRADASLWWRHERLHRRAVRGDFATTLAALQPGRDALEARFDARMAEALASGDPALQQAAIAQCWAEAEAWEATQATLPVPEKPLPEAFRATWSQLDELAGWQPAAA